LNACQTHLPIISDDNVSNSDISGKAACEQNIERIELADIDYLLFANKMIDSMMQSRNVQKKTVNNRMRLYLSPVHHSDVDMNSLNTSIKNRVMRSGLFIIVNDLRQADFQLSGTFETINKQANLCNENYEVFSLYLNDSRTDAILWSEHKQFY